MEYAMGRCWNVEPEIVSEPQVECGRCERFIPKDEGWYNEDLWDGAMCETCVEEIYLEVGI